MSANPFALQSYCLREFRDNARAAALVKECGLDAIEIWSGHIDFQDPSAHQPGLDAYAAAGVTVVSTGVNKISGNPQLDRPLFEFARRAGTKVMSVDFAIDTIPDALRAGEQLAEEFDMRLGIHNHGGRHWLGSSTAIEWVLSQSSARIGLCLDTAWAIDSRESPVDWVRRFGDRLYLVHLKDMTYTPDREPHDVIVGTGNLNLDDFDAALTDVGFDGVSVLEYEGDPHDPVAKIRRCAEALRSKISSLPAA